jgi:hypothetical protein
MTSDRKKRANRANSKKSTGPQSKEGKSSSAKNSYKHGIWAKQLTVSQDEEIDYKKLVNDLDALLKPEGPILQYYFDEIILCMWRLRRLISFENAQFAITDRQASTTEPDAGTVDVLAPKGARGVSEQLRILKALYQRTLTDPVTLSTSEKDLIREFFGEAFLATLERWLSSPSENYTELFQEMLESKSKRYGLPDLQQLHPETSNSNPLDSPAEVAKDPEATQMRIEVKRAVLLEIIGARIQQLEALVSRAKNTLATPDTLELRADLQLRYSAALKRDLRKAINAYHEYKRLIYSSPR